MCQQNLHAKIKIAHTPNSKRQFDFSIKEKNIKKNLMLSASLDNENEIGGQVKVRSNLFFAHKNHNHRNGSS